MEWSSAPEVSVAELRGRIDVIDDHLAQMLDERAVLSAEIQDRKRTPGHVGRDTEREREIVERMARRAPHLGAERLAVIMDAVIRASLDAAGHPED
jgi:chorismate mutase